MSKVISIKLLVIFYLLTFQYSALFSQEKDNPNLNCIEEKDKNGNLISKGCYLLEKDKTWAKHGTWLHFNKDQNLIDSINYSHGTEVGTRATYNAKGEITLLTEYEDKPLPRIIKQTEFTRRGSTRKIITTYKQIKRDSIIKNGILLNLGKNDNVMDSIVYNNGKKRFSAHFYKSGGIASTSDFGKNPTHGSRVNMVEYNKDGTIRSKRTEFVGYNGVSIY